METYKFENVTIHTNEEMDDFNAGRIYQKLRDEDLDSGDVTICDEDSADELVEDYIKETLWAFDALFMQCITGIDSAVFEALQPQCERANQAVLSLIESTCGLDELVEQAVSADGRAHFLSTYDGEENEIDIDGETYFVYRTN